MESKLKEIMASVFEVDSSEINAETSSLSLEKWDSLRHMKLIIAVEEEFEIEFLDEEIAEVLSYKDIVESLSKKLN